MVGTRSFLSGGFGNADGVQRSVVPLPRFSFGLAAHRAYCFKCGRDAISARELAPNGVKQILGRSLPLFDWLSPPPAIHAVDTTPSNLPLTARRTIRCYNASITLSSCHLNCSTACKPRPITRSRFGNKSNVHDRQRGRKALRRQTGR